jgi:hypothetical protein
VVPRLSRPPEWLATETRQWPTAATMLVADERYGSRLRLVNLAGRIQPVRELP